MAYTIPFYAYLTEGFGGARGHRGIDVAPGGNAFPAWVNGVVVTAGYQSCLGNRVVVQNDADGYFIGVSHLASISVSVGQRVGVGTTLGYIGNTGSCSNGRHAHITVSPSSRFPESGPVINPVNYANSSSTAGSGGGDYAFGLTTDAQLSLQRAMSHVGRYGGPHDGAFGVESVSGMQQWLKDLGYLPGDYTVDGVPGPSYGEALQKLARDKGGYTGPIDGAPGEATSDALIHWAEVVVIQNGGGTADGYAYGLNMEAMRQIQAALTKIKYYDGPVDGVFGPRSVAAMQEYLKARGFLPADYGVDGEPGPQYGLGLQKLAATYGYEGAMDGVPGDQTSAALIRWADWVINVYVPSTPTDPEPEPKPPVAKWPTTGTFGIDVASPQRDLDFAKAKAEGARFAIIKTGGLNVTPQYVAPHYAAQVDRARAAGLKIGHYYLLGLGQTPEQQAAYFVLNAHDFRVDEDVLALDNEKLDSNGTRWDDADAARFLAEVRRLTGLPKHRAWHYGGANDYRTHQPWTTVEATGEIWWAAYGANDGTRDHEPSIQGSVTEVRVHQFSSTVELAGYKLDGNWSKYTVEELFAKGTVTPPEPEPEPEPEPTNEVAELVAAIDAVLQPYRG